MKKYHTHKIKKPKREQDATQSRTKNACNQTETEINQRNSINDQKKKRKTE